MVTPRKIKPKPKVTKSLFIREIPYGLHCAFRAWCSLHDVSVKAKIIAFMRQTIKETRE